MVADNDLHIAASFSSMTAVTLYNEGERRAELEVRAREEEEAEKAVEKADEATEAADASADSAANAADDAAGAADEAAEEKVEHLKKVKESTH